MLLNDPLLLGKISAGVARLTAEWERRPKGPLAPEPKDDEIVGLFESLFDVHASAVAPGISAQGLEAFKQWLEKLGESVMNDVEAQVFRGPFDEKAIRELAKSSADLPSRLPTLSPEQQEQEIQAHVARIKGHFADLAKSWHERKQRVLVTIKETSLRKQASWLDSVQERLSHEIGQWTPTSTTDPVAMERREAVNAYISEVFRQTGKKITRTAIWRAAGYKTRSEFERWERNDRRATASADRAIRKVLSEKPHLK